MASNKLKRKPVASDLLLKDVTGNIHSIIPCNAEESDFSDENDSGDEDIIMTQFDDLENGCEGEDLLGEADDSSDNNQSDSEWDSDVPLAAFLAKNGSPKKKKKKTKDCLIWDKQGNFVKPDTSYKTPAFIPFCNAPPTPLEVFKLFMSDDIFELIAEQTISYSDQKAAEASLNTSQETSIFSSTPTSQEPSTSATTSFSDRRPRGRPKTKYHTKVRQFSDEDRNGGLVKELHRLFAVLIRMGITQLPNIEFYWSENLGINRIKSLISSNRFFFLMRSLHFIDNNSVTGEEKNKDRLWKIRLFMDKLNANFQKIPPEEHNSVDEQMVAFKGRSVLKQYMPKKPIDTDSKSRPQLVALVLYTNLTFTKAKPTKGQLIIL